MANVQLLPAGTAAASGHGPMDKKYRYFVSFVAAVGGFLFGYDLLIISGAAPILKNLFNLSDGEFWSWNSYGLATSSGVLGCIAGPTLGAWLCDRLGRKGTLIIAAFLFIVGAIGTAFPGNIVLFNVYRIVGGVGVGLASIASPMYINEIAPARNRGSLGIMYQFAITIGCTCAVLVAWGLAIHVSDDWNWRLMFLSIIIPIAVFIVLLLRVPQSPRWLAERGRDEEALAILTRVDGPEHARAEMAEIKNALNQESGSWRELFQPGIRMALVTGILLALFNNWTGWSGIAYYIPTIIQEEAKFPQLKDAIGVSIFPLLVHVSLTFAAIHLVDRTGRRPLWLWTSAMMFFFLLITGWIFYSGKQGWIAVSTILLIAIPHAIGLGPLPWLMMSEIFPTRIRARAVSITTTFLWFAGFTGPFAFPKLLEISKTYLHSSAGVFWMYAVVCVLAFIFGLTLLPETKGRTLEEIAKSWEK